MKELLLPGKSQAENFWALRDINLEVAKGETLGIIGQNGSGKSTLLQIIAGTLTPTTGKVWVNGRVSALLELGSGFNPEFTGRQNVFFNGRILGLSREEIDAKFDDIAAFADIGDFLDQPVKTYSSGMVVRLAFAVVANTDPQILIVDEALAVGDAKFQARCMKRIRQLKEQGVTILFVSHDCSSIKMLCQQAVLMSHGLILDIGSPKDVVNHYIALLSSESTEKEGVPSHSGIRQRSTENSKLTDKVNRHGNQSVVINSVRVTDVNDREITSKLETGSVFNIVVDLESKTYLSDFVIGFSIRNLMGVVMYGTNTNLMEVQLPELTQGQSMIASFKIPCYLNKGVYTLTIGVHSQEGISYDWMDEILVFEVVNRQICDGLVDLNSQIKVNQFNATVV
ncbi:MAG TPA: ABC transporter ATP-binding protein [Coleofasciculaceae cyanobacterium]